MTLKQRCSADTGNLFISYTVNEDQLAVLKGYTFLGVAADASGGEVHVFQKEALDAMKATPWDC